MVASGVKKIGGFLFSVNPIETYVDSLNRALVKVGTEIINDQEYKIDGAVYLLRQTNSDFYSEVTVIKDSSDSFNSVIKIEKGPRKNPYVEIISQSAQSGAVNQNFSITASGYAFNENGNRVNDGISSVIFNWTDGDYDVIESSGDSWTLSHSYSHSGLYKPYVAVKDHYGRVGGDITSFSTASGISNMPIISLSGIPRSVIANTLSVDFYADLADVLGDYTLYWDYGNGFSYYNNTVDTTTQYNFPGDYIPYIRVIDGRGVYVCDSLKIGYNR